jgi:uridine kinase
VPQVVVLAGPSGSGKSHLAERLGLPILRLDDFYKDGDDPTLPRLDLAGGEPIVDWDDAGSWNGTAAVEAVEELCRTGCTDAPVYDIATSSRTGHRVLQLDGAAYFVAEGIFAQEVVPRCQASGLLAAAYCVRQHPMVTFWRRLTRDLREHRKPPLVLLRRGLALMRAQKRVVAHAVALGCEPVSPDDAFRQVHSLVSHRRADA